MALEIFEIETPIWAIRHLLRPRNFDRERFGQLRVEARTNVKSVR